MFTLFGCFDMFVLVIYSICTVYILGGSSRGALPVAAPRFSRCLQVQAQTWIAALRTELGISILLLPLLSRYLFNATANLYESPGECESTDWVA
jgi:hypothetical protein